jgi:hypothetical protein
MFKTKDIDEVSKIISLTKEEVNFAVKKFEKRKTKKTIKISNTTKDSIELINKINELIDKNMDHFKLTKKMCYIG